MHMIVKELITGCDSKKKKTYRCSLNIVLSLLSILVLDAVSSFVVLFIHAEHVALE